MTGKLRVLYVDDEPDIRTIVTMALGMDPDLEIRTADSGQAALDLIKQQSWMPDIALLDMMMPEMSGRELLDRLKASDETRQIPVLFVTASARQADIESYLSLGAAGVITKPFDPLALASKVREHFERIEKSR